MRNRGFYAYLPIYIFVARCFMKIGVVTMRAEKGLGLKTNQNIVFLLKFNFHWLTGWGGVNFYIICYQNGNKK